jgi:hypothetical protein
MNNPAVSKHHCKLQWRKDSRVVQLRILDGITYVNEKRLDSGRAANLKHGDLLEIHGKGQCFRMLLNLQPINDLLPDIRSTANYAVGSKEHVPATRTPEEEARRKIRKLRAAAESSRKKAMEYEERLISIQSSRSLCHKGMKEDQENSRWFEKDHERLFGLLAKSRDDWLERLQQQSELHDKAIDPLQRQTAENQMKRDSIFTLNRKFEREAHPELYDRQLSQGAGPSVLPQRALPERAPDAAKEDEAEGEEEAFADAPARGLGLEDEKEKDVKDEELPKPTVEVLRTAPTGADDDDIADLFGDFDSDEEGGIKAEPEPEPKRQRVA